MSDLNPSSRKDPKFLAALVLIGLVVVAGLVLIGVRTFNGSDSTASPETPATATSKPSGSSSACGLSDGDQAAPTTAPETKWYLNGTLVTPQSKRHGPGKEVRGAHSCFSRSAIGAVFAAANAAADIANTDVDKKFFLESRAARTEGYDEALAALGNDEEADGGGVQFAGFRVDSSSTSSATVQLVVSPTEGPTAGGFIAITYYVTWTDGDWLVVIPKDGVPVSSSVTSLDGYIPWSGS